MQTQAIFENIAAHIVNEIYKSKVSIYIAVAWFTNKKIFHALVQKAKEGCSVFLMYSDDAINEKSSLDYELLNTNSSKVYRIGDGEQELMHNKFCVIDHRIVITGSYNWTHKAEINFENIVITYDDTTLAEQFIAEFKKIKNRYYPESEKKEDEFPLFKIINRLEILKNFILLEEIVSLKREAAKLKEYEFHPDIKTITLFIDSEDFVQAIKCIERFISKNHQLTVWEDPEISALKLKIKNLENQITAFDNEKVEMEKTISDFQHRYAMELGEHILEILRLKKVLYKDNKEKYKETEKDEKHFKGQLDEEKEKVHFELNDEQRKELKTKFRKATTLCHPDKFSNESIEIQKEAETIFKELNEANIKNDINKVSEILENLENGILNTNKGDSLDNKTILTATIEKLKYRLSRLRSEILKIKQSDTFKEITTIEDWDVYFEETKQKLQLKLENLRSETNKKDLHYVEHNG